MRKHKILVSVVILAVFALAIGGTWWLARTMQSPAQRQAAAQPPQQRPVSATVTTGELTDTVTANATISALASTDYQLTLPDGTKHAVVTKAGLASGKQISSGSVLLWINDRPVFAFSGAVPAYRDLRQGDSGTDVLQLQQALASIGYQVEANSKFDDATARALTNLYQDNGSEVNTTTAENSEQGGKDTDQAEKTDKTGTDKTETDKADKSDSAAGQAGRNQGESDKKAKKQVLLNQSEYLFVPSLEQGRVLTDIPAAGARLSENAKLTVAGQGSQLSAELPAQVSTQIKVGATAWATIGGKKVQLTLSKIEEESDNKQGSKDSANQAGPAAPKVQKGIFTASDATLLSSQKIGSTILITIERTPTIRGGFIVPKRAVAAAADGTTSVLKLEGKTWKKISVEELGCVAGQCSVKSTQLRAGDQVRVDQ